jgi:ABC-2 type transport system permease protein
MNRLQRELNLVAGLASVNLSSAMEYRASFITQIVFMFINNGIYFVFWLIFFEQFGTIRGYNIDQIYLLFAVVALSYGMAYMFAANVGTNMAALIAHGRLDYYLVFPRNLLLHVIFSRMQVSTVGDVTFGLLAYVFTGRFHPVEILLFLGTAVLASLILIAFAIIAGSLAFYMGNAQFTSAQMENSMMTFALYPNTLFSGLPRLLLFTLIPAAFVGAVPVSVIEGRDGWLLLGLLGVTVVIWGLASAVFYHGLRRYESGSAINVNM